MVVFDGSKPKQRLNKLASLDYDNFECWQIVEAFNKAQIEWVRRQLHGSNNYKEGDEASIRRIDDLQKLLKSIPVIGNIVDSVCYQIDALPDDYLEFKRVSIHGITEKCTDPRSFVVYLAEEADIDLLLVDKFSKPSFDWGETFCTLKNNKVQIYTNGQFNISSAILTYYRQPNKIQIANCVDPYTGVASVADVECEFKDDLVELFIDEASKIIAGDIEAMNQFQRNSQSVEGNN